MKMLIFLILFQISGAFAHEKSIKTIADTMAHGQYTIQRQHPWPFPLLSIGHNMQSYQKYGFSSPYWHDGLDIRSEVDQPIYSSVEGTVVNIENYVSGNPLYWEVAILDREGFVWKYHHVDQKSIPESISLGKKVSSGTLLGNVVRWPVSSFGEIYHHLHLLIVGRDGKYINPFLMMTPLPDTVAPVIHQIGLSKNHEPIKGSRVSGGHGIYVETSDLTLHDKFILPPHKISYRLNQSEEKVVWEFIHLPSGTNDTDFIKDFYLNGSCGNYSCRKFLINLNFEPENPRSLFKLMPGTQEIEVLVEDIVGNRSMSSFTWTVH